MKKILVILFVLISTIAFSEPRMNFYTDVKFQEEESQIFDLYLAYPINKEQTMLNVLQFFYAQADTMDRFFVIDDKTNKVVLSFCFTKYSEESAKSVSLMLVYPYNSKYKDLNYVIKNAEFKGVFSIEEETKTFTGNELKKELTKLISNTDEDVEISPMP